MKKQSGITLTELMLVVAIIGILASVSSSWYTSFVLRTERTDECMKPVAEIAIKLEKWKDRRGTYTQNLNDLGYVSNLSPDGVYTYRVVAENAQGAACNIARCYSIQCTRVDPASDSQCATMIVDNFGRKNVAGGGNVDACWDI